MAPKKQVFKLENFATDLSPECSNVPLGVAQGAKRTNITSTFHNWTVGGEERSVNVVLQGTIIKKYCESAINPNSPATLVFTPDNHDLLAPTDGQLPGDRGFPDALAGEGLRTVTASPDSKTWREDSVWATLCNAMATERDFGRLFPILTQEVNDKAGDDKDAARAMRINVVRQNWPPERVLKQPQADKAPVLFIKWDPDEKRADTGATGGGHGKPKAAAKMEPTGYDEENRPFMATTLLIGDSSSQRVVPKHEVVARIPSRPTRATVVVAIKPLHGRGIKDSDSAKPGYLSPLGFVAKTIRIADETEDEGFIPIDDAPTIGEGRPPTTPVEGAAEGDDDVPPAKRAKSEEPQATEGGHDIGANADLLQQMLNH